jgi:hypothetical protein
VLNTIDAPSALGVRTMKNGIGGWIAFSFLPSDFQQTFWGPIMGKMRVLPRNNPKLRKTSRALHSQLPMLRTAEDQSKK